MIKNVIQGRTITGALTGPANQDYFEIHSCNQAFGNNPEHYNNMQLGILYNNYLKTTPVQNVGGAGFQSVGETPTGALQVDQSLPESCWAAYKIQSNICFWHTKDRPVVVDIYEYVARRTQKQTNRMADYIFSWGTNPYVNAKTRQNKLIPEPTVNSGLIATDPMKVKGFLPHQIPELGKHFKILKKTRFLCNTGPQFYCYNYSTRGIFRFIDWNGQNTIRGQSKGLLFVCSPITDDPSNTPSDYVFNVVPKHFVKFKTSSNARPYPHPWSDAYKINLPL
nr:Cap [Trichosanthes kirilowii CRESS virus]